jgi:ribosomal protein S18 acetylase RimI-like enzyme
VIRLAPATAADLPALARWHAALRVASGLPADDLPRLEAAMGRRLAAGYAGALFDDGAARVGYALWRPEPEDDRVFLRHFFVAESHRRRGVGRAAFAALRALWPAEAGVALDVAPENARGIAFWRAMGFELGAHRLFRDPEPREDARC